MDAKHVNPWVICEENAEIPKDAKGCLYCRECIVSTSDGFTECFECLKEGFAFYDDEIPETKKCEE